MAASADQVAAHEAENIPAGIGLMLLAIFTFSANDVLGKWLAGTYSVGQILLFRSVAALVILAPFIWRKGLAAYRAAPRPWLQVLRIGFATGEVACFYWSVATLPLANAMTFYLAGPIYVTMLAGLVLGEHVGWRRWSAVAVGFAGVVVALQPSSGTFGWPSAVACLGSILFALLMITTRYLRGTTDVVLVSSHLFGGLVFGALTAPFHWVPMNGRDMALTGVVGIVSMAALVATNRSLKLAPASVVVPYQYSIIVWAIVFGYLVFHDVPAWPTLAGGAIIIGAGLFIFFREQKVAKDQRPSLVTEK